MERPNTRKVQLELFWDYRTNRANYPKWQQFLRETPAHDDYLFGLGE